MRFQSPLVAGRLIRRYKRFLADVRLEEDGSEVVAHCPNPGAMTGLAGAGTRVWLEPNHIPGRKLKFGWRLVDHENGHFTGVDTSVPNRMLRAALLARQVPALAAYENLRTEVKYGRASRVDFLLSGAGLPDAYVEVKSVTLCRRAALAEFPDCVTARGTRHLEELVAMRAAGCRAVMLYLVQRTDCDRVALAGDIDPTYAAAFADARAAGVEALCHATAITPRGVDLGAPLPLVA